MMAFRLLSTAHLTNWSAISSPDGFSQRYGFSRLAQAPKQIGIRTVLNSAFAISANIIWRFAASLGFAKSEKCFSFDPSQKLSRYEMFIPNPKCSARFFATDCAVAESCASKMISVRMKYLLIETRTWAAYSASLREKNCFTQSLQRTRKKHPALCKPFFTHNGGLF